MFTISTISGIKLSMTLEWGGPQLMIHTYIHCTQHLRREFFFLETKYN